MIELPTISKVKKTPKPRYKKPDSVKQLEIDYFDWKYRQSSIPVQCRFKKAFRDDTANGLRLGVRFTAHSFSVRTRKANTTAD